MYYHKQSWQKRKQIIREEKTHIKKHIELMLESHPYRNELIRRLAAFNDDDSFIVLLSFLGQKFDQDHRVMHSIDASNQDAYNILITRIDAIEDLVENLVKDIEQQATKIDEILEQIRLSVKIQKNLHWRLTKKTQFQKAIEWLKARNWY